MSAMVGDIIFCVTSRWHVVNSSLTSANLNLRGFEIWREEIRNRNRLLDFGGKKFEIEIDSSILAGRNSNKIGGKEDWVEINSIVLSRPLTTWACIIVYSNNR